MNSPQVIVPTGSEQHVYRIRSFEVESIICHRRNSSNGQEQYLVNWRSNQLEDTKKPYSWHNLNELSDCLIKVQRYLNSLPLDQQAVKPRPRNTPIVDGVKDNRQWEVMNGVISRHGGTLSMKPVPSTLYHVLPTEEMKQQAAAVDTRQAQFKIRNEFDKKLAEMPAHLEIINQVDGSRPPLDFQFIENCRLGKGVVAAARATVIGCGNIKSLAGPGGAKLSCRPNMGDGIGCQYSRVCECLEFASVDTTSLATEEDVKLYAKGEMNGLPKRFPYGSKSQLLTKFYLDSRHCIYECNPNCQCGPDCRTRVVQKGRTIPLQIFKTAKRGWGLRCKIDLKRGQFIDTYRGEIITDTEAERRERNAGSGLKASYLYSLDKHIGENGLTTEDCYVVDGEFMGGPTRFLNHSCDPNVRQYTVSYNKYDTRIYELAFFACRDIPAGEELTFDYLDKDDDDDSDVNFDATQSTIQTNRSNETSRGTRMKCLCGSDNCRGVLWV